MNEMKKIKYTLLLICSLMLVGCFEKTSIEHWIDNPTTSDIKVVIDGNELAIPANSGVNYKFEFGQHNLSYNNDTVNFTVDSSQSFAIINPTLSNYVIYRIEYKKDSVLGGVSDIISIAAGKKDEDDYKTSIIINGELVEIEAPFKAINDLFINKEQYKWDYFLDDPVPDSVKLRKFKSKSIKMKIFRENDFFKFLKKIGVKDEMRFPANSKKLSDFTQQ
jgi:hypothetical protein